MIAPATTPELKPTPRRGGLRIGVAVAFLLASAVLCTITTRSALRIEPVDPSPTVQPVADSAEKTAHLRDAIGTFATGSDPGDYRVAVNGSGHIRFSILGAKGALVEYEDSYQLGHRGDKFYLITSNSGLVELDDIDTVVFAGDQYHRRQP